MMDKTEAIQVLIQVAKLFLEREVPTGIRSLLSSDVHKKKIRIIQDAIELLEQEYNDGNH